MAIATVVLLDLRGWGGMKRELVPGRWQMAVESMTGFVDSDAGRQHRPRRQEVRALHLLAVHVHPVRQRARPAAAGAVGGIHPFTFTSHFTATGVLAIMSFAIVLIVGFWKHGFHFFSLFVPHGTPLPMIPLIFVIELVSFLVRPFSLGLRLFVAMMAGHVLLEVLSGFVINGVNAGWASVRSSRCSASPDDCDLRPRNAGRGHPGLRLRAVDLAVHQRRREPSLIFVQPISQFRGKGVFIMEPASAKLIGAGLAAIGAGMAAIGVSVTSSVRSSKARCAIPAPPTASRAACSSASPPPNFSACSRSSSR
jgi:ATP synthase subunit 6